MTHTIAFVPAILITLNIMLGAGLFLNTTELAQRAGALGFLAYIVVGILMLPLVLGMSKLVSIHPHGGFYTYGAREIHPYIGFISAWTYFVGKLASASLMIHTATLLMQNIIPTLQIIHPLIMDHLLIILFCILNTLHIRTGSFIQYFFFSAKLIPVTAMISAIVYWFNADHIASYIVWDGIPSTIPLVLYAVVGFEAACSLSSKIEQPDINAPRVILYAYGLIVILNSLYQWCAFSVLGTQLVHMKHFFEVFSSLAQFLSPACAIYIQTLFYCSIAISVLGAAYGILYSNLWNMHTLAHHDHTWFKHLFTKLNKYQIPTACVLLEGIICSIYLICSHGTQVPLQQITSLSIVFAYTISAVALWQAVQRKALHYPYILLLCALVNCCMLSAICAVYLVRGGSITLLLFFGLLMTGLYMAWTQKSSMLALQKKIKISAHKE